MKEAVSIICTNCETSLKVSDSVSEIECPVCGELLPILVIDEVDSCEENNDVYPESIQPEENPYIRISLIEPRDRQKKWKPFLVLGGIAATIVALLFFAFQYMHVKEKEEPQHTDSLFGDDLHEDVEVKQDTSPGNEESPDTGNIDKSTEISITDEAPEEQISPPAEAGIPPSPTSPEDKINDTQPPAIDLSNAAEDKVDLDGDAANQEDEVAAAVPKPSSPHPNLIRDPAAIFSPENIKNTILKTHGFSQQSVDSGRTQTENAIKELADGKSREQVSKEFTREIYAVIAKKAETLFIPYKIGEKITALKREGHGYVEITGIYDGIHGTNVKIGHRYLPMIDMPTESKERLSPATMESRRNEYLKSNFHEPRRQAHIKYKLQFEQEMFPEFGFVFNTSNSTWKHIDVYIESVTQRLRESFLELGAIKKSISSTNENLARLWEEYRLTGEDLTELRQKAKDLPKVFTLHGYIIANLEDDNFFEIAETVYSSYHRSRVPTERRALLMTVSTTFTTKGNFTMDVVFLSSLPVKLKDEYGGFNQGWKVYKEATEEDFRVFRQVANLEDQCNLLKRKIDELKGTLDTLKAKETRNTRLLEKYNAIKFE